MYQTYGFPKEECAKIMLSCIIEWLRNNGQESYITDLRLVHHDVEVVLFIQELMKKLYWRTY